MSSILLIATTLQIPPVSDATVFIIFVSLLIGIIFSILLFITRAQKKEFRAVTFAQIDQMSGVEFEQFIADVYRKQGYRVSFTQTSGDMGVDLILQKGRDRIAVQTKRYKAAVGRAGISDAVAGKAHYRCERALVVTNRYFTPIARKLARANNCGLIDRTQLAKLIARSY